MQNYLTMNLNKYFPTPPPHFTALNLFCLEVGNDFLKNPSTSPLYYQLFLESWEKNKWLLELCLVGETYCINGRKETELNLIQHAASRKILNALL